MTVVSLTDEQLDRLADLMADKLADRLATRSDGELIDPAELAQRIGRSRDYIYANAGRLGVVRLGDGERPRLAFRWPHVLDRLDGASSPLVSPSPAVRTPRSRPARRTHTNLLPIRGDA